jgi:hypothetical protein
MDNEIMQALLFQYIGMKWSAALKNAFRSVVESGAWKRVTTTLTRDQLKRRQAFLQENPRYYGNSIESLRKKIQLDKFFLTQLPTNIEAETPHDEEPKEGEKPNQGLALMHTVCTSAGTGVPVRLIDTRLHTISSSLKKILELKALRQTFTWSDLHGKIRKDWLQKFFGQTFLSVSTFFKVFYSQYKI